MAKKHGPRWEEGGRAGGGGKKPSDGRSRRKRLIKKAPRISSGALISPHPSFAPSRAAIGRGGGGALRLIMPTCGKYALLFRPLKFRRMDGGLLGGRARVRARALRPPSHGRGAGYDR